MSYSSEVLADSPLLYCMCDDTSGTSAADSSGNSRPLTINGSVTLAASPLLSASTHSFDLAGSGGAYLSAAYDSGWMPLNSGAFSIELWFNADSLSSIRGLAGRDGVSRGWEWYINASKLTLDVPFVSPSSGSATGSTTLSTGTNYHVVLTYDGTTAKQYLNGVQDASCNTTMLDPANRLTVGATAAGAVDPSVSFLFDGRFDEVAYYGSALSSTRVAAHYAARASISPDATVTPPAATATAAARVPVVSAASAVSPPAATATAAALAPTIGAGGNATVAPPAATATATAIAPSFTQIIPAGTDTSNSLNGRRRRARGSVVVVRPAAVTPSRAAVKYDKSVPLPPPVLVDGRLT